jgi:la-related protein 1
MTSTPSRSNGDAVAAPPVFSYAQAAKGRAAATTASAIQSHQSNTSGISTPAKDNSAVNTPSGGSERGDRSVNGSTDATNKSNPQAEIATPEWRVAAPTKSVSNPTSPSFGTASTSTLPKEDKDDDFILVGVTASEARERSLQAGNVSSDKPSEIDGRRGKKGKKQKNADKDAEKDKDMEKDKEEVKPEILVPAPLPTVNFWQQRSQELSKVKPSSVVSQSLPGNVEPVAISDTISSIPKDTKKRGKSITIDETDKNVTQNGVPKEFTSPSKGQRKGGDGSNKPREEQPGKRAGPRGSRVPEKDEKTSSSPLPPPVEDSISWPTPETALEEEKRKVQEKLEKEEKDETAPNKPRPKEKWVPVPYVPSVSFNTPIPPRGGRGRGGARGGRTEAGGRPRESTNAGATGEKTTATSTSTGHASESDRGKDGARSTSLPPPKRQPNDQSNPRKPTNVQSGEKNRSSPSKGDLSSNDIRQASMPQPDQVSEGNQDHRESFRGSRSDQTQGKGSDNHVQQRASIDRSSESSQFKDGAVFNKDGNHQSRERVDGRGDRGRGGFRGRGNHGSFPNGQPHPQHVFTNGHGPQQSNTFPLRQSNGPYSPPPQQPFGNQYMPTPSRGRGSSRSQSIPNGAMYGPRFMPNGGQVPPNMPSLQTSGQMFDYPQPMQSMSALPYNPYIEHVSVLALVTMQLEYYFSIDNLCKDVYLRKHMDSQGFVFLTFIAGFKRIQALTQDFDLLRHACQESDIVELVRGADGADRLRRKEGWEKWVLAIEERDESVRNDGPAYFNHPSPVAQRLQYIMPSHQSMSPTTFSPNGTDSNYRPYTNGVEVPASSQVNGNGDAYASETPLSAAVADFAPAHVPVNGSVNGTPDSLEAETTFSDDEVAHLTLVFLPKGNNDGSKPKSPFHGASRTFSNGSIDGRSIAEELSNDQRQGRTLTNGSHTEA